MLSFWRRKECFDIAENKDADSPAFLIVFESTNNLSSSFVDFASLSSVIFIEFMLSSSSFCQAWDKFKTRSTFFEFGKKSDRVRVHSSS